MTTRKYKKKGYIRYARGGVNRTRKNKLFFGAGKQNEHETTGKRHSLFETLGTAAKTTINNTANFLEEKGARFLGFERINQNESSDNSKNKTLSQNTDSLSQNTSGLLSTASNIASGIANKANQIGVIIVDELNKNMEGPVKDTVSNALGRTVEATKDILEAANDKLNDPEFVEDIAEVTKNATETASTILEASEPALNDAIDKVSEIGTEVASKVGESSVSVALNTAEAVPGAGALIGLARDADKLAIAGEAIVEAGAETATTFADTIVKAEEAIKDKMEETSEITNRIENGVDKFNKVDNILGNHAPASETNLHSEIGFKKGGRPSKKFRKAQRRLSRKLRFKFK
jgi:hypothetical protein